MLCFGLPGVTGLCPKAKGASLSLLLPINSRKQAAGTFNRLCYSDDAPQLERTYGDSPQLAELLNGIRRGETPLFSAASGGCPRVVQWLLLKGANAWIPDLRGGRTPLHIACLHGHSAIVKALLNAVDDARYKDVRSLSSYTPLHYAVASGDVATVQALLEFEPALTASNGWLAHESPLDSTAGTTPLHMAASRGSLPVAMELLRHYAERAESQRIPDPRTLRNKDGCLPWHVARERKHYSLARVLLPSVPLHELFEQQHLRFVGVRSLQTLAARALRHHLRATIAAIQPAGGAAPELFSSNSNSQPTQAPQCSDAQGAALPAGRGCGDEEVDDDDVCGICFDAVGGVRVAGCGHALCAGCAGQLARQVRRSPAACPFCRGPIGGFGS